MVASVYDFKDFYNTRLGRITRRILNARIAEIWSDCKGLRVMGVGYAVPFLRNFSNDTERTFVMMPAGAGVHHWPDRDGEKNLAALSEQYELPIETNSIDRVIMAHDLEHCEFLDSNLSEIWRVLKSNGRLLIIAPNRAGVWARSDKTPFGQGQPFSVAQLNNLLRDNQFVHERTEEALFMPPVTYPLILKFANLFEKIGRTAFPIVAGVHIIEVSKQLYARADKGSGSPVTERAKRILMPKPATSSPRGYRDRHRP